MQRKPLLRVAARLATAIAALLAFAGTGRSLADASLVARRDFIVGKHPVAVLAVDFDQDGHLDLLTVDQISNVVSLVKGFGDGYFRQLDTLVVGSTPTGARFADVNGDGHPDIVTSNFLSQDVRVNLGDGTGSFGAWMRTGVGATPFGLVVGHWNGDPFPDVATVNSTLDSMSILLGLGTGLFGAPVQIPVGNEPRGLISGHFNADANPDLAVVNTVDKNVKVWQGDGLGGFSLLTTLATGGTSIPVSLASADLDEDGDADIVVCDQGGDQVLGYFGNGAGQFGAATNLGSVPGPNAVLIADHDGDNHLDLLVVAAAVSGAGELAILTGDGTGDFAAPVVTATGPNPTGLAAGDFDADGDLDVVASSLTGNTVSFIKTDGAGIFLEAEKIPLATESFPFDLAVADFNGDSDPDVASANLGSDNVAVALGDGQGGFAGASVTGTGNLSGPEGIAAVNISGDGDIDLVTMNTGTGTMSVLTNNGSGNFQASNGLTLGACLSPTQVAVGELSGDMIADLAIICDVSDHLCTRIGTGGSGSAAFGPAICTPLFEQEPGGIALGNFNFDALADAAITSRQDNIVALAMANGAGGVTDIPNTLPVGTDPTGVARGDVNGDGFDDIVVAAAVSANITTYLLDGGGAPLSFPGIDSPAGEGPFDIGLADFNQDGKLDAAVVNGNANNVSLLLGDGFGNFSKAGDFGARNLPLGIGVGDFNGDGWPDLAVADHFGDSISVLLNRGILSNPLQEVRVFQGEPLVFRWGLVPGATYDIVRAEVISVVPGPTSIDLGPALCLANDLAVTDTANQPDPAEPTLGQAFVYFVRPTIAGVSGSYGTSDDGRERVTPAAGCP
jgi:hypothetical protein